MSETASEPAMEALPRGGVVTVTHGGDDGTQVRAVILDGDGVAINVVLLPANHATLPAAQQYSPGDGLTLRDLPDGASAVGLGWTWDGKTWTEPEPAPDANGVTPEPTLAELQERLVQITAAVDKIAAAQPAS